MVRGTSPSHTLVDLATGSDCIDALETGSSSDDSDMNEAEREAFECEAEREAFEFDLIFELL